MMEDSYTPSFLNPITTTIGEKMVLSPDDWSRIMHPEDKSTIEAMEALPGFSSLMKMILSGYHEKYMKVKLMGNGIKLSEKQLPEYYKQLLFVCEKLRIEHIPDFYLVAEPIPNAFSIGETDPIIMVTTRLMQNLTSEDLQTVLAHECGHILFKHQRYTLLALALTMGLETALGHFAAMATMGGLTVLKQCVFRWLRMSELSADRVAVLFMGSSIKSARVVMRGLGPETVLKDMDPEAYYSQIDEYADMLSTKKYEEILNNLSLWNEEHPPHAYRVMQMREFSKTQLFRTMARKLGTFCCPKCGAAMQTQNICVNGHML